MEVELGAREHFLRCASKKCSAWCWRARSRNAPLAGSRCQKGKFGTDRCIQERRQLQRNPAKEFKFEGQAGCGKEEDQPSDVSWLGLIFGGDGERYLSWIQIYTERPVSCSPVSNEPCLGRWFIWITKYPPCCSESTISMWAIIQNPTAETFQT